MMAAYLISLLLVTRAHAATISNVTAIAFVREQFGTYFSNCSAFVDSFGPDFEYCDGAPCVYKRADLLKACLVTEGCGNEIYKLDVLPMALGGDPDYSNVIVSGLQAVAIGGTVLCFNFGIHEDLFMEGNRAFSSKWVGYYTVMSGPCQLD